jgi:hypothetical protein
MMRYIIKLSRTRGTGTLNWFLEWSTIVKAPLTIGMSFDSAHGQAFF